LKQDSLLAAQNFSETQLGMKTTLRRHDSNIFYNIVSCISHCWKFETAGLHVIFTTV